MTVRVAPDQSTCLHRVENEGLEDKNKMLIKPSIIQNLKS